MTALQILEVAVAAALIAGGIVLYRRRTKEDSSRGSQSGVLLIMIGLILAIHGLGLLEYRPSQSEIEAQALASPPR
jgi:nitrate reductase gamma subunit